MGGVEPLLNYQRTFNELIGECFTAHHIHFTKRTTPHTLYKKLSESLAKSHQRINCSKSTTEILEQDVKYIQN